MRKALVLLAALPVIAGGSLVAAQTPYTANLFAGQTAACSGGALDVQDDGSVICDPSTTTAPTPTTTPATTSTTAPKTTSTTTPGSTGTDSLVPEASLFGNSSLFNQVASNWPVDPNSATLVSNFYSSIENNYGYVGTGNLPIYYASASTPDVTVNLQTTNCGGGGGSLNGATSVPVPAWLTSKWSNTMSTDNPMVIYQPSANNGAGEEWELWQMRYNFTTASGQSFPDEWSACYGGDMQIAGSDGILPNGGLSATRISYLATAITENDINSGAIDHAMAIQLPDCNGGVYPATDHDCGSDPGYPAEGQYFIFSPTVNCANYDTTKFQNEVCVAGKTYGFVATDFSGLVQLSVEDESDWSDQGNVGNGPTWGDAPGGGCCEITVPGQDPIGVAETANGTQYQDLNPPGKSAPTEPWSSMEVVDPPAGY